MADMTPILYINCYQQKATCQGFSYFHSNIYKATQSSWVNITVWGSSIDPMAKNGTFELWLTS